MDTDGMPKRGAPRPTFADLLKEVKAAPPRQETEPPGHRWDRLTDPSGRRWLLVAEDIDPERAQELVKAGAAVAWDYCGSRGWGEPIVWLTKEQAAQLARGAPPQLRRNKRNNASLSEWSDTEGAPLVLASMSITWGKLMDS
jgi:hypothetical protein